MLNSYALNEGFIQVESTHRLHINMIFLVFHLLLILMNKLLFLLAPPCSNVREARLKSSYFCPSMTKNVGGLVDPPPKKKFTHRVKVQTKTDQNV